MVTIEVERDCVLCKTWSEAEDVVLYLRQSVFYVKYDQKLKQQIST